MQRFVSMPIGCLRCLALAWLVVGFFTATASAIPGLRIIYIKDQGFIRGVRTDSGLHYLGIPYAAPPVGELRWQPPKDPERWTGIRDASQFAPHCPQVAGAFGSASVNEDCLYLNVYTPHVRNHRGKDPVMVWIHGGGLVSGLSDVYDPTKLVEQGMVVVTINYRLGALGLLAHPALSAESPEGISGNYGLKDQQAALRWVQKNIRRFGGDPDNITIFGESAGGYSVHAHLVSPGSAGLFHKAIIQSGAYLLEQPSQADYENVGMSIAATAGCPDQDAACMRALPVETILANQDPGAIGFTFVVDGEVLPMTVSESFNTGMFNQVPVMEGTTHDEWSLFVAIQYDLNPEAGPVVPETYPAAIAATLGIPIENAVAIADNIYPATAYPSASEALTACGTDAIFACPAQGATSMLSQYVPVYAYEFNDPNTPQILLPPVSFPYKAFHSADIFFIFYIPELAEIFTPEQVELSETMVRYWAQFADAGDPNSAGSPEWPQYDVVTGSVQSLAPSATQPITTFGTDHKCAFWLSL